MLALQQAIDEQHARGRPAVLRLTGPHARDAAAAWTHGRTLETHVLVGSLPPPEPGVLWLDDAPGARAVADTWIAYAAMEAKPWTFLLTGRSVDGGHPEIGITLEADAPDVVPTGPTPTIVVVPAGDLRTAADQGHLTLAHALYEQLADRDPTAAREWVWIEVLRLRTSGRLDEAEQRAVHLPDRHHCPGSMLLQMAAATYWKAELDRAEHYARAALRHGSAQERADARYIIDCCKTRRGTTAEPRAPHTTWWRALMLQGRALRDPTLRPTLEALPGAFAETCVEPLDRAGHATPSPLLRLGHLREAFRAHANQKGSTWATGLYELEGRVRLVFDEVEAALRGADLERADLLLTGLEPTLRHQRGFHGELWVLLWGRVRAHFGDVSEVLWCAARLRDLDPSALRFPSIVELVFGPAEECTSVWCSTTWLRTLHRMAPTWAPAFEAVAQRLPSTPVALGPYELQEPLAQGGMGTVWQGRHVLTDHPVAVKVMHDTAPERVAAFRREVEVVANLEHPAIVAVLDRLEVDGLTSLQCDGRVLEGQPALVMEFLEGGTLADQQGELSWPDLHAVLHTLLDALAYAHANGIIHRDLKPMNVLSAGPGRLRLSDFGVAALSPDKVVGTPAFMAPEQFRRGAIGPEADLYALGCMAWALATGFPPYIGPPRSLIDAHRTAPIPDFEPLHPMPAELRTWLHRCLAKDPRHRFRSAAQAADALPNDDATCTLGSSPSRTTRHYALATLLDLPEADGQTLGGTGTQGTLHDVFDAKVRWQPRIPTSNLLHHGDPPVLWQEAAQQKLWTLLLGVVSRRRGARICLVGPRGHGRRMLVRWLRRRAHMAGLRPSSEPLAGRLCILDATGTSPEDWDQATRQPWLLIWRRPVADVPTFRIRRLGPHQTWWVLHSRILLSPKLAAETSVAALGHPGLAVRLIEDWIDDPGVQMSRSGLHLRARPPRTTPRASNWWKTTLDGLTDAQRLFATYASLQLDRFPGRPHRQLAEDLGLEGDLSSIAHSLNDCWRVPGEVRELLEASTPDTRPLHEALAEHQTGVLGRRYHHLLADGSEEATLALAECVVHRLDALARPGLLGALELHLDLHLMAAPEARQACRIGRAPQEKLWSIARQGPLQERALALAVLLSKSWNADAVALCQPLLPQLEDPAVLSILVRATCVEWARRSRLDDALSLLDRTRDRLEGHPEAAFLHQVLDWTETQLPGRDGVPRLQQLLSTLPESPLRRAIASNLMDALLEEERYDEALDVHDQARGNWSVIPPYNRVVALLGLGRLEEAGELAAKIQTFALVEGHQQAAAGLCAAILATHPASNPVWDKLLALAVPVPDPVMAKLLHGVLDQRPGSPSLDRVRALLG